MELQDQLKRQRVRHIVSSYQLDGSEPEAFAQFLDDLLLLYPSGLVELALVDVLAASWLHIPMEKGCAFLEKTHALLRLWRDQGVRSSITSDQFQQVTGLDPGPLFGQTTYSQTPAPRG
jgi:hypothetical protein